MINPINSTVLRTNDALSKEERQERRRNRKHKDESEDHAEKASREDEDITLDLVA